MTSLTPDRLRDLYLKRVVTLRELIRFIDSTNIATLYDSLSQADRDELLKEASSAPHGDGWDLFRIVGMGGYCNYTAEEFEEEMKQDSLQYRTGIEAFREFLGRTESDS